MLNKEHQRMPNCNRFQLTCIMACRAIPMTGFPWVRIIYIYIYITGSAKTSLMDQNIIWRYDRK